MSSSPRQDTPAGHVDQTILGMRLAVDADLVALQTEHRSLAAAPVGTLSARNIHHAGDGMLVAVQVFLLPSTPKVGCTLHPSWNTVC